MNALRIQSMMLTYDGTAHKEKKITNGTTIHSRAQMIIWINFFYVYYYIFFCYFSTCRSPGSICSAYAQTLRCNRINLLCLYSTLWSIQFFIRWLLWTRALFFCFFLFISFLSLVAPMPLNRLVLRSKFQCIRLCASKFLLASLICCASSASISFLFIASHTWNKIYVPNLFLFGQIHFAKFQMIKLNFVIYPESKPNHRRHRYKYWIKYHNKFKEFLLSST